MPHDAKGNLLQVGDLVALFGVVDAVYQTEEYCNVTLRASNPAKPTGAMPLYSVNSAQLEKQATTEVI